MTWIYNFSWSAIAPLFRWIGMYFLAICWWDVVERGIDLIRTRKKKNKDIADDKHLVNAMRECQFKGYEHDI